MYNIITIPRKEGFIMTQAEIFQKLYEKDVSEHTEKKDGLTYLSWAWAWAEFKKICPTARYEIKRFNGLPYVFVPGVGYMVFTSVTVEADDGELTYEMFLPVMDGANKAMTEKEREYEVFNKNWNYALKGADGRRFDKDGNEVKKYIEKTVKPADMFDINKAIMRCLTKNLAMFGLGLYIYAGEDLPGEVEKPITEEQIAEIESLGVNVANTIRYYKVKSLSELTEKQAAFVIESKKGSMKNEN